MLPLNFKRNVQYLHILITGHNACMGNGGCEYLCLPSPNQNTDDTLQHSCACPDHKVLALDKYSCVAKGKVYHGFKTVYSLYWMTSGQEIYI